MAHAFLIVSQDSQVPIVMRNYRSHEQWALLFLTHDLVTVEALAYPILNLVIILDTILDTLLHTPLPASRRGRFPPQVDNLHFQVNDCLFSYGAPPGPPPSGQVLQTII